MDPAELIRKIPLPEVAKLRHVGGKLEVDSVRGPRLLVRDVIPRTDLDRYEESGLVLPQGAKEQYTPMSGTGFIIRVGDGVPPGMYEEGQAIFFSKWSGTVFTENTASGNFRIVNLDDVLCTLRAKDGLLGDAVVVEQKEAA